MKFYNKFFLLAAISVLSLAGCKEKEVEASYLGGSLELEFVDSDGIPLYVESGKRFVFKPKGLVAEDAKIGYYMTDPATRQKDTIMAPGHPGTTFTFEIPDTLGYVNLSVTGFAYDSETTYYTSSISTGFHVVDQTLNSGSLTGFNVKSNAETLAGKSYYVTKIGQKTWMRQNLADFTKGAVPYCQCEAMENIFGGFYTWQEAQTACPDGWHLPTDAEWCEMLVAAGAKEAKQNQNVTGVAGKLIGYVNFNGEGLWNYWGFDLTDATLFSALPTGYAVETGNGYQFSPFMEYACYWTADEYDGHGVYRYIKKNKDIVYAGSAEKDGFLASVRCVK